jgi:energy-converting hydrogenase Eha subunit C
MTLTKIIYWSSLVTMLLHCLLFVLTWHVRFALFAALCMVIWIIAYVWRIREEPSFGEKELY